MEIQWRLFSMLKSVGNPIAINPSLKNFWKNIRENQENF